MSNSGSSSLRPAWKGGRGFQPPPTVTSERETRGRSSSISGEPTTRASNKYSALQDDDDFQVVGGKKPRDRHGSDALDHIQPNGDPKPNSRGEAFRSSFQGVGRPSKPVGRSLADLAARVPEGITRAVSTGAAYAGGPTGGGGGGGGGLGGRRFSDAIRTGSSGDPALDERQARGNEPRNEPSAYKQAVDSAKVIRYTREKLLALRPRPILDGEFPPPHLKHVDAAVLLSTTPQDPVCWDTLDADEIWATVPARRSVLPPAVPKPPGAAIRIASNEEPTGERRRSYQAPSSGRWARGQTLPPTDEKRAMKEKDADSPDDLWDDPIGGAIGAATDFSAFGGMPEGDIAQGEGASMPIVDVFDFEKMAEATRKFEEELHGSRGSNDIVPNEEEEAEIARQRVVDPKRPLATVGTMVQAGSGDNVNVFEDFDAPSEESEELAAEQPGTGELAPVTGITEDPTASSRLMAMIGVKRDDNVQLNNRGAGSLGEPTDEMEPWNGVTSDGTTSGILGLVGPATTIPLNPWGDPILPTSSQPTQQNLGIGMDLASRLESFAAEQKAREAAEREQKELLRRRQEQEEQQRRVVAQQQAQERARQQNQQTQQQQPSAQSQVELVLMERITTILENSWGRSDLMSILSTLHAEDSRVIPLLSNVDLLRDLIAHNPRRVALRQDPAFGTEMAVLQMTNVQFQQHEAQVRVQQEELRRREEQLRLENMQRQRSLSHDGLPRVNPEAPWFYSDPQGNIQGPFRGDEMRQWLEAGYFKGDLPISQQAGGPFIALSLIFPDISVAFTGPDRSQEEAEARARAEEEQMLEERRMEERRREELRRQQLRLEEERRLQEQRRAEEAYNRQRMAQEQARRDQEAREAAERERHERETAEAAAAHAAAMAAASADNSNAGNQSSAQLKMMLGLSSSQHEQALEEQDLEAELRESKNNIQKRSMETSLTPQMPPKPVAPAWGGAAKNTTTTKKSMSEIQQEEARRAAVLAMQQGSVPRQSSSGWANVAAAGTGAWTPGTVKPSSAAAVVPGGPISVSGRGQMGAQPVAGRAKPTAVPAGARRPSVTQPRGSAGTTTAAEEFGTSMSPALENWCKEQMKKMNGTDDLTLVSFCMTLDDAIEIRQYLTTYLGSTPQVNNFATEFINKKGLGPPKQEEWETPGSAKKGRKKKGAPTR